MKRERRYLVVAWGALAAALACQPDWLAGTCNRDDPETVYWNETRRSGMQPKDGDNYISQNPALFLSCENFLCLSSNGSVPYCTKPCGSDSECVNGNNIEMECRVVTQFGQLACRAPSHDFCDENACRAACPTSCLGDPDPNACKTKCEEACPTELCCERDERTHGVKDPAMYCRAVDGKLPHDAKALPAGG